jgi:hypothetical protein
MPEPMTIANDSEVPGASAGGLRASVTLCLFPNGGVGPMRESGGR